MYDSIVYTQPHGGNKATGADGLPARSPLMQHHRIPTRLLDWTTNALAALFLALENYQSSHESAGLGRARSLCEMGAFSTEPAPIASSPLVGGLREARSSPQRCSSTARKPRKYPARAAYEQSTASPS
jgi:hypothetical protein